MTRPLLIVGLLVIAIAVLLISTLLTDTERRDLARTTIGTIRDFPWLSDSYGFEPGTAESNGLNGPKIQELSDRLTKWRTKAFLIIGGGKVVHERYARFYGARARHYSASLAKALAGSMVLLIALDDGRIKLQDRAWRYIPEWRDDPLRSEIQIADLANHSSGIEDWIESGRSNPPVDDWKEDYRQYPARRFEIALNISPVIFFPGTRTEYSNPGFAALSYALAMSLRDTSTPDTAELLRSRIMEPLGIPETHWQISYGSRFRRNGMSLYLLGGGGNYTARAVARLGQLIAQRGKWNGGAIISAEVMDSLTRGDFRAQGALRPDWMPLPVIGWWSNADEIWPHLPKDTLVGAGAQHQVVVIIPSRGLVVVRQGDSLGGSWGKGYWLALDQRLLQPLADILSYPS